MYTKPELHAPASGILAVGISGARNRQPSHEHCRVVPLPKNRYHQARDPRLPERLRSVIVVRSQRVSCDDPDGTALNGLSNLFRNSDSNNHPVAISSVRYKLKIYWACVSTSVASSSMVSPTQTLCFDFARKLSHRVLAYSRPGSRRRLDGLCTVAWGGLYGLFVLGRCCAPSSSVGLISEYSIHKTSASQTASAPCTPRSERTIPSGPSSIAKLIRVDYLISSVRKSSNLCIPINTPEIGDAFNKRALVRLVHRLDHWHQRTVCELSHLPSWYAHHCKSSASPAMSTSPSHHTIIASLAQELDACRCQSINLLYQPFAGRSRFIACFASTRSREQ
ncbi:uncharacterized protein MYCFIDRAFT_177625 [Pseudocercospora fijiensis CIRAD86]|uniref:Uncharacterized protein n=1 Tax=Pseudocercospora fijiensis (strain CIRAD86) TaxID=383855 RepID=M2YSK1_PSEFD|nr:uncharacterized protein MYCFIDRAFT_177625 [Pseudocercospora fijiensis CIRAD86]EME80690.1 hypothetical protein MYCFIDRAFT_177625 [Pseudocercospora fijiensis CIRAD86]